MVRKFGLVTLALSGLIGIANAADFAPEPPAESDWVFTAAPYLWLAGINGSVRSFGAPEEVDIDFSIGDVLKNLDMGLMGAGEARNGRFLIASDVMWAKLSGDTGLPLGGSVELTAEALTVTGLGGYSLFYGDGGNLDLVAGARLWSVSNTLDFSASPPNNPFNDSETWIDPVVGIKGRANISPNLFVTGWALTGGYGVSSKFMWDAMASVGYEFNDTFSMTAGYRGLGVDYRNDGFVYDVVQSGPILGFVFKF